MGSAVLYNAAHMQAIEDATVTSMVVNSSGHLIVTRHDGSTFDAGDVSIWLPARIKAANNLGAGNDPNALLQNGWYAGTNWANSLLGYTFGIVEVLAYDATYIVQNFYLATTPTRWFTRSMVNSVWGAWVEKNVPATTTIQGEVVLASDADAIAGVSPTKAVTPHGLFASLTALYQSTQTKIMNGSCRLNQRGYVSGTSIPIGTYWVDRWKASGIANLIPNPSAEGTLPSATSATITKDTTWSQFRTSSFKLASPTNQDSFLTFGENVAISTFNVVAGKTYTISGYCKVITATSGTTQGGRTRGITVIFNGGSSEVNTPAATNTAGTVTRVSTTFTVPLGTTTIYIRAYLGATVGTVQWDGLMLTEGTSLYSYFDGSMGDCSWAGTADGSISYNTPNVVPTATFTADPNFGQIVTLNVNGRVSQPVERSRMPAGSYTFAHSGTAQMRVYNKTIDPTTRPAFSASPFTFTADGTDDVIVEFTGGSTGATFGSVRGFAGGDYGFALEPIERELDSCQRYYARQTTDWNGQLFGVGMIYAAAPQWNGDWIFPKTVRGSNPYVSFSAASNFQVHQPGKAIISPSSLAVNNGITSNRSVFLIASLSSAAGFADGGAARLQSNNVGAYIEVDAEIR